MIAIAERLLERVSEDEPDVLDGVMAVDLDVAGGTQRQVEHAVARERIEHVRQERQWRVDRPRAGAVEREVDADLRLLRVALDARPTCHSSLYQPLCERTTIV